MATGEKFVAVLNDLMRAHDQVVVVLVQEIRHVVKHRARKAVDAELRVAATTCHFGLREAGVRLVRAQQLELVKTMLRVVTFWVELR